MTVIAIYSLRTNRLRRIISDEVLLTDLLQRHPPGVGEAVIEIPNNSIGTSQQILINLNGITPSNDQYCAVQGKTVVHTFIGDLDCGDSAHSHPGSSLVIDDAAKVGWRQLQDDTLARSLKEVQDEIVAYEIRLDTLERTPVLVDRTREELDGRISIVEDKLTALRIEEGLK